MTDHVGGHADPVGEGADILGYQDSTRKCLCQVMPPQAFRWTCGGCGTEHPARHLARISPPDDQHPLTTERLAELQRDDPITLVTNGRITTHRVTDVDVDRGTVTLADRLDDGCGWQAALTYRSDNIHDAGWDGNDA